jgi:hypothetical protein
MLVYLGTEKKHVNATMATVHATMSGLTIRIGNLGQKLCGQFFSSPDLFNDLHTTAINSCGTVRPDRKVMPSNSGRKLRLKWGGIKTMVKGDLIAAAWKDKQKVNIFTDMHCPPAEGD